MYRVHDKVIYKIYARWTKSLINFINDVNCSPILNATGFVKLSYKNIIETPLNYEIFLILDEMPASEVLNRIKILASTNSCKVVFCPFRTLTGIIPGMPNDSLHHYKMDISCYPTKDKKKINNIMGELSIAAESLNDLILYVTSAPTNDNIYIDTNLEYNDIRDFISAALYKEIDRGLMNLEEIS